LLRWFAIYGIVSRLSLEIGAGQYIAIAPLRAN
jgi:hypothetical protein